MSCPCANKLFCVNADNWQEIIPCFKSFDQLLFSRTPLLLRALRDRRLGPVAKTWRSRIAPRFASTPGGSTWTRVPRSGARICCWPRPASTWLPRYAARGSHKRAATVWTKLQRSSSCWKRFHCSRLTAFNCCQSKVRHVCELSRRTSKNSSIRFIELEKFLQTNDLVPVVKYGQEAESLWWDLGVNALIQNITISTPVKWTGDPEHHLEVLKLKLEIMRPTYTPRSTDWKMFHAAISPIKDHRRL